MMKSVAAVVIAFLVGGCIVAVGNWIGSSLHPAPEGFDPSVYEQLQAHAEAAPISAQLAVIAGWAGAGLVAGFLARILAKNKGLLPAAFVLTFFTLAVTMQLVSIPSPIWMWFLGLLAFPVCGLIGMSLVPSCDHNVSTSRTISASLDHVFEVISKPEGFQKAVPGIQGIEYMGETKQGVGTRFVETRIINGRKAKAELEVTELVADEHVRLVSDMGGTLWDTIFTVKPSGAHTEMTMSMDARPHNPLASLITPLILPMVSKAVENDMDAVKDYCESQ